MKGKSLRFLLLLPLGMSLMACGGNGGGTPNAEAAIEPTMGTFIKSIIVTQRSATDIDGVAIASCLSTEVVVGGGAYCTGSAMDYESGILFSSHPSGNGYIGACYPWAIQTYTPIKVYAVCSTAIVGDAVVSLLSAESQTQAEEELHQMIEDYKRRLVN